MFAKDNFVAKTSLAVSSIEFCPSLLDEGQIMGNVNRKCMAFCP
jgi:hypothetical protein